MHCQSLREHCLAPGGPGSIWNHRGGPVRSTGVSGWFACGFRTDLHLTDDLASKPMQGFSSAVTKYHSI
jgi:hypothetical protein